MATVLSIIALIVAAAAFGVIWKLQQELAQATRRLDRYNRALFDANDQLRILRDDLNESKTALRVEMRRAAGTLRFEPTTTLREAERMHPQVAQVLASFHIGGCQSCAADPEQTLEQVCEEKGAPLDSLLATLGLLVGPQANGNGAATHEPVLVKLPNVSLEIK